jgi:hypothetical protein
MDRKLARKNLTVGLVYATLCAVIFGLAFVAAAIYLK